MKALTNLTIKKLLPLAALTLSAIAAPTQAAQFGVKVVDDNGTPIAGASVCIGLQGNYKQFGAGFTDMQGQLVVDVPNVPLLVTVSKTRFSGTRTIEPARSFNLIKQVKLKEGVPGPRCRAGSIMAEAESNVRPATRMLTVSSFNVEQRGSRTTLSPEVNGNPSHFRVSTSKDFEGAKWQKYSSRIALAKNVSNSEKVYFQLRKRTGSKRAWMEATSDVLSVRLVN